MKLAIIFFALTIIFPNSKNGLESSIPLTKLTNNFYKSKITIISGTTLTIYCNKTQTEITGDGLTFQTQGWVSLNEKTIQNWAPKYLQGKGFVH